MDDKVVMRDPATGQALKLSIAGTMGIVTPGRLSAVSQKTLRVKS